ncbi:hypothetical protein TVAG_114770 [Trichomonas vaginalis G3]|uniref:Uncharacterized protein n=1 Tax=Trichomonas vaginalis (strain ATCC PRA-98 / G3) TaxID=412133 RepID=A2FGK0_TRIV3|nr:hypothetical protein TVAG_114770 [Trichomonas vaginalis G3]|eukprot:XP_001308896.1 hypothetical protein [Trichomonas vaginalis G3]
MTNEETVQNTYSVDFDNFSDETIHFVELTQAIDTFKVDNIVNDTVIRLEGQNIRIISRSRSISINIHIIRNITFKFQLKPSIQIEFLGRFISTLLLNSMFLFKCEGDTIFNIPATPWMNSTSNIVIDSYGFLTINTNCSNLPISIYQMLDNEINIYFNGRTLNINGEIDTRTAVTFNSQFPDSKLYINFLMIFESDVMIGGNVHNSFIDSYKTSANCVNAPLCSLKVNKFYIEEHTQMIAYEININKLTIDWYSTNQTKQFLVSENLHIDSIIIQDNSNQLSSFIPLAKTKNKDLISETYIHTSTKGFNFISNQPIYQQSNETVGLILERQSSLFYITIVITEANSTLYPLAFQIKLKELHKIHDALSFSYEPLTIEIKGKYTEPIVLENLSSYCVELRIISSSKSDVIFLGEYPKTNILFTNVNLLSNSNKFINSPEIAIVNSKLVGNFSIQGKFVFIHNSSELNLYDITANELSINYKSNYTIIAKSYIEYRDSYINITKINDVIKMKRIGEGILTQIDIPHVDIVLNGINHIKEFSKFDNLHLSDGITSLSPNISVNSFHSSGRVTIFPDYTFNEDSSVSIYSGIIESSVPKTFKIKNLSVVNTDLSLTNVTFVPENFVISGSSDNYEHNISCRSIVINQDSHASLNSLNDFCDIIFNYSIYQTGYLFVHNITQSSECNVTAHFINNDIRDQVFYNDVWDNFSIDVLCSDIFNVHYIDAIFSSFHWNFNSSTSYFDMSIQNKSSQTCISIVRRTDTPENSDKHVSNNIIKIIIIAVCISIGLAVITTVTIIIVLRHRKLHDIERFMSETPTSTLLGKPKF